MVEVEILRRPTERRTASCSKNVLLFFFCGLAVIRPVTCVNTLTERPTTGRLRIHTCMFLLLKHPPAEANPQGLDASADVQQFAERLSLNSESLRCS